MVINLGLYTKVLNLGISKTPAMKNEAIIKISPLGFPWETIDPFIFCVHHRDLYPEGNENMGPSTSLNGRNIGNDFIIKDGWRMYHGYTIPGFPYHPHRGFETVTIVKEGIVDHTDSLGAAGRFGAGDVQWMTAGKGVQHSEMFPLIHEEKENHLEIFQIWLNLPKASKMVEPHFKMLWNKNIPLIKSNDSHGKMTEINLIAGRLDKIHALEPTPDSWASDPYNEVAIMTIKMEAGAQYSLSKALGKINRTIYFYNGEDISINETSINSYHSIKVKSNIDLSLKAGQKDAYLLVLQGKPISEPVVQYGPFVMNTEEEIQEAYSDFRKTQFGGWPWPNREQVHPREKGRFALHADGTEEKME